VERLFGYTRAELLGRSVELLVPERAKFFANPDVRTTGLGGELSGRRKDGSEFPLEVGLSTIQTPRGPFVLASVIDLTERRRAEDGLRASRLQLRLLTGRLLEAQEVERRRIARELHDDVNQSLALLAVELDLLAGAPPGPPADAARGVRELSARVKELSSSVHDLSHRLHPSKLEQLGLVAAIRGLCQELGQSHNLDVKFTHYPEPGAIPPEAALSLYRIVQEGLRNVIKHSGSRYAAVELAGSADAVRLRIADDGSGFDPAATNGGLGLVSMRERLHLIGGRIGIDSRPAGGTRIDVWVPLRPPTSNPAGPVPARGTEDVR
jgi:signal transduction histidine kinase